MLFSINCLPKLRSLRLLPLLLLAACQPSPKEALAPTAPASLQGTWLNAHEENRGDTLVYRPNTYKFPPARGRTGFAIEPGGRFVQYDIAPTDGVEGHDGTWTADDDHLRIHLDDKSQPDYTLEILSADKKTLTVKRL